MPVRCAVLPVTCNLMTGKSDDASMEKGWGGERERSSESVADNGSGTGYVDSQLWHACAGAMVQLPRVGAKVIYFPQGHAENAPTPPDFPPALRIRSTIPCRVVSIHFLADTETDEVYARLRLQPELGSSVQDLTDDSPPSPAPPEKLSSFAKTLTQSDANNGGGFSVPRYCAETIFPRLDYSVDPPVQTVLARDVHGEVWKFRHIYRGTPRRHLLTTGWSAFVNQKKLVAGDAIVFLRSANGELRVGVRRSTRGVGSGDPTWHLTGAAHRMSRWVVKGTNNSCDLLGCMDGAAGATALNRMVRLGSGIANGAATFARNRARVTAESVLEAATLAAAGQPFNAIYYPRSNVSEFCIKEHDVRTALQQSWVPGMRFKMAFETEDSSRISWFMGTIAKVQEADPIGWSNSPWKMLLVTWDEPDLLQGVSRVSPWQVELVSPMQLPPFSLPKKKIRVSQLPEIQLEGQSVMGLTMATLANNALGHLNPWHGFTDSVPAGMQGARHDHIYGLSLQEAQSKIQQDNFCQHQGYVPIGGPHFSMEMSMGNFVQNKHPNAQSDSLSAILSVGNSPQNEPALSSNVLSWGGSSSTKSAPFLLFGKAIDTAESAKAQPQFSGGSSADGPAHGNSSDGNQSEVLDKMHMFFSGPDNGCKATDTPTSAWLHHAESSDSPSNGVGTLKWFKEQGDLLNKDKGEGSVDSITHCKVFRESEKVGRTVDLSDFGSYKELYEKLSKMFGIEITEIFNRVVYMDFEGCRHVGDEPYRDFMKKVRRLKILSEFSSESITK